MECRRISAQASSERGNFTSLVGQPDIMIDFAGVLLNGPSPVAPALPMLVLRFGDLGHHPPPPRTHIKWITGWGRVRPLAKKI